MRAQTRPDLQAPTGNPEDFVAAAAKSWRFGDVGEEFIEKHCGQYNRASTTQGTSRLLKTRFVRAWGPRDIREVRKRDVIAVVGRDVDAGLGSTPWPPCTSSSTGAWPVD
jgi:hypothetical protein